MEGIDDNRSNASDDDDEDEEEEAEEDEGSWEREAVVETGETDLVSR